MQKTAKPLIILLTLLLVNILTFSNQFEQDLKQGILFYNSGDFEKAIGYFKKTTLLIPEDLTSRHNLAVTYFKLKDYIKALETASITIELYPADEETTKLINQIKTRSVEELQKKIAQFEYEEKWYGELAYIYYLNKEYEKALEITSRGIKNNPRSAYLYDMKARVYQMKGDFDNAAESIETAFNLSPDDPEIFDHLKKIFEEKTKYGNTQVKNTDEPQEVQDVAEKHYMNSVNAYSQKNWELALTEIDKAITLSSNNAIYTEKKEDIINSINTSKKAAGFYNQALKSLKIGKYLQAVDLFKNAINTEPNKINYIEAYTYIVECYKELKDYDKEIEYAYKILELEPNNFVIWLYLADAYFFSEKYQKSYDTFKQIQDNFADSLTKYNDVKSNVDSKLLKIRVELLKPLIFKTIIGILVFIIVFLLVFHSPFIKKRRNIVKASEYFRRKSWSDVVEALEPVINYNYSHFKKIKMLKMLVCAYIHVREYDKAEALIKEALHIAGDDEELIYYYAIYFLKKNTFSTQALYAYKVYYQREPNNQRLLKMIVKYFWEKNRNPEFEPNIELFNQDKMKILETVFTFDKDNLELVNLLAQEYEKRDIFNMTSIKVFERLLEFNFENIKVHLLLARAYLETGKHENAIKEAKFVFRRDINNSEAHDIFKKAFISQGELDQLLIEYENLLQVDPANVGIKQNIMDLRKLRANYRHKVINPIKQKDSDIFAEAIKLFNDGKLNDSITLFNDLFEKGYQPKDTGFYLTFCYMRKGFLDLAYKQYKITDFDEELLEKRLKELIYQLGVKLEIAGQYERALEMFDKICKVDISYRDVFERYENIALNMEVKV